METSAQDPLAISVSGGADSSHESYLLGNVNEITHALPSTNAFDEAEASSTDTLSLEKETATDGGGIQVEGSCRYFSLDEIKRATNDFDNTLVIGIGGFGKVYKGMIDGGATNTVAIKRLNAESKQGAEEFRTEVKLLSKLRHTHLVSLIGHCYKLPEMILVYEYIPGGTLASHLYKTSREESVLCGRPPVDTRLEEEQISLILWATTHIKKRNIDGIIDPSLVGETTPRNLKDFAELAKKCLHTQPKDRPTMAVVVKSLQNALVSYERERRSQGMIAMTFQGIKLVHKGMSRWWKDGEGSSKHSILKAPSNKLTLSRYHRFSFEEIRAATNDFDKYLLIEEDTDYRLYNGFVVEETLEVAIKRYNPQVTKEVSSEIRVHSLTSHPNIVSLIGYSDEKHELILVYEYMVNGTLRSHLWGTDNNPLPWKKRLEICIDIARGLEYLHMNIKQQIIHRDIKSSNILLDDKWVAKVAAFEHSVPVPTGIGIDGLGTIVRDTIGHLDPEYFHYRKVAKKSDVYSFGALLVEVLCAKKPCTDKGLLTSWFIECIKRGTIDEVIDPYLIGKIAPECFRYFVIIALSCMVFESTRRSIRRPSMDIVLESLQSSLRLQEAWENSIKMGDELSMANVPSSYNTIISVDGEVTIGEQSFLISNLIRSRPMIPPSFSEPFTDPE
ncbi:hypothetical protein Vadar_032816 [Vaccinium darrowii]|uniref:Uncharacterized protein n=1 Tax=Vaccinium darrowii TaxID=229202 RepID=A0ACB7Z254_9ERIC|nr:hypothetical protein Vadar_032816 [Vaccinium darrowii]